MHKANTFSQTQRKHILPQNIFVVIRIKLFFYSTYGRLLCRWRNPVIGTSPIIFDVVKKRISRPSPEKPTSNVTVKTSKHKSWLKSKKTSNVFTYQKKFQSPYDILNKSSISNKASLNLFRLTVKIREAWLNSLSTGALVGIVVLFFKNNCFIWGYLSSIVMLVSGSLK